MKEKNRLNTFQAYTVHVCVCVWCLCRQSTAHLGRRIVFIHQNDISMWDRPCPTTAVLVAPSTGHLRNFLRFYNFYSRIGYYLKSLPRTRESRFSRASYSIQASFSYDRFCPIHMTTTAGRHRQGITGEPRRTSRQGKMLYFRIRHENPLEAYDLSSFSRSAFESCPRA